MLPTDDGGPAGGGFVGTLPADDGGFDVGPDVGPDVGFDGDAAGGGFVGTPPADDGGPGGGGGFVGAPSGVDAGLLAGPASLAFFPPPRRAARSRLMSFADIAPAAPAMPGPTVSRSASSSSDAMARVGSSSACGGGGRSGVGLLASGAGCSPATFAELGSCCDPVPTSGGYYAFRTGRTIAVTSRRTRPARTYPTEVRRLT